MPDKLAATVPQSSAAIVGAAPRLILKNSKTVYVESKTVFVNPDTVHRALALQKDWPKLGLTLVQDKRVADLLIEIDHTPLTYVHTFVIVDKRTSILLGSGKATAFDGNIASGRMAKSIVKIFSEARLLPPAKEQ